MMSSGMLCMLVAVVVAATTLLMAFFLEKRVGPKGVTAGRKGGTATKPSKDCTREAFREKKVPEDLDYVVVGSGMGSLYCAALLAKCGKKCVVLEQHYVAGGCTHSFEDKGYEFDTGLHYVGRIEKYKLLIDLVTGRNATKVEWAKMGTESDNYCYDEIKLGADPPHHFCAGQERFIEDLVAEFPDEREAITAFVQLSAKVNKMADMYFFAKLFHPLLQWVLNKTLNTEYLNWANKTTWEVVCSFTENKRLRAILCGQFGNYGLRPQDSSFIIQAGITAHYMGAAYYPVGGSQQISRAIIPCIEEAGGKVLVKARVKSFEIQRGRCVGVRVVPVGLQGQDKGDVCLVTARGGVISGAGAHITHELVPKAYQARLGYTPMLNNVSRSISHAYAFIGLKGSTQELGLRAANLWVLPVDKDYNYVGLALDDTDKGKQGDPYHGVGDKNDVDDMLLFMGFPSVKDPSFSDRFPGKSTCEIITTAHPEWFEQYLVKEPVQEGGGNPNQSGKRDNPEYDSIKRGLEEKLLRALYRHFPKCKGKVDYVSIGTPLTNMYYLNRPDSYGLEHSPAHYAGALDGMRPHTNIPGLYATGQDIGTVGIVGALNGGILTAHAVLGYGFMDLVVQKRNLIEDLMEIEKMGSTAKTTPGSGKPKTA